MNILFVTGTDTGVGKTVFTVALLWELRRRGVRALAMKPFCSGSRRDVELIQAIQGRTPAIDEVNPFYFAAPVTPLAAARQERRRVGLPQVLNAIAAMSERADALLVEGAGGLLSPLGLGFSTREVIESLKCPVVVVAANRLGTINHTRLTVEMLHAGGIAVEAVVLMGHKQVEQSAKSNVLLLRELLGPVRLVQFPYLGAQGADVRGLEKRSKIFKKTLAPFCVLDTFCARSSESEQRGGEPKRPKTIFEKHC